VGQARFRGRRCRRRSLLERARDAVQDALSIHDAGEGPKVEHLPGVEGDQGIENDSHGVVVDQRRTPYLARQLSVFMIRLRTTGFPS
jgi:hypothetical protein